MTPAEQMNCFQEDLERLIDRYRAEFDLSIAEAVGTLECVKLALYNECSEDDS